MKVDEKVEDQLLKESKVFCMAPWVSLNVQQNGDILPCCYSNLDPSWSFGNLRKAGVPEIWNSSELRRMRVNMLNGEKSPQCAKCYAFESANYPSLRNEMNKYFGHHVPDVRSTEPDGTVGAVGVRYLDIRFSNVCNFKCRYCGVYTSTGWYKDHQLLGRPLAGTVVVTPTKSPDDLWREIEPLLPGLERIYFTGGEPLLSPQAYRLLNRLVELRSFHTVLLFSTNFSTTRFNGTDIMDLWNKFDHVDIGASLDAMGPRGEYIRKGQSWEEVLRNRQRMFRACPKVNFAITPTVTLMNVLHLPDFHWEWVRRGYIEPNDIHINLLFQPEEYCVQLLPQEIKRRVAEKYGAYIERLTRMYGSMGGQAVERFQGVVDFMMARDGSALLDKFRDVTRALDQIRGESFEAVFPELVGLMGDTSAKPKGRYSEAKIAEVLGDHFPENLSTIRAGKTHVEKPVISVSPGVKETDLGPGPYRDIDLGRLNRSDVFCVLPWSHLDVRAGGKVFPCCAAKNDAPLGSLPGSRLEEIWNSKDLRQMRINMLEGKKSDQCTGCYLREENGHISTRRQYNSELNPYTPLAKATQKDGSLSRFNVPYLEIGHPNRRFWDTPDRSVTVNSIAEPAEVIEQVKKMVPGLAWLRFSGGEPLDSRAHYEIVKFLVETERFDVRLSYLTDFSTLRYEDMDMPETWGLFHHVDVGASLDGSEKRGEYLRNDRPWDQVVRDRDRMFQSCPRANFNLCPALSALNVFHLPDFHREWIEKGYIGPEDLHINVLRYPEEYTVQILPETMKSQVEEKYKRHIGFLKDNYGKRVEGVASAFQGALGFLRERDTSSLLKDFCRRTRERDKSRGGRFDEVFPELSDLMREASVL